MVSLRNSIQKLKSFCVIQDSLTKPNLCFSKKINKIIKYFLGHCVSRLQKKRNKLKYFKISLIKIILFLLLELNLPFKLFKLALAALIFSENISFSEIVCGN